MAVRRSTIPLERLRRICLALPGAWEKTSHGEPTFWVAKKMFAMFANAENHHGAGRHAVWCKSTPMTQSLLVGRTPDRCFVPPYVGPSGWVGIYLDRSPDWADVTERLRDAYRLVAPKRALAALDANAIAER
jgi:predicted DNA-binding protein (MmcQ/YjbR family)